MQFFELKTNRANWIWTTIFILVAFAFALALRTIWVLEFQGHDQNIWNAALMINTNDGYYFAEGARDILAKVHQNGDLSPIDNPLSLVTAWLAVVLPVSFETLILWMPAVFGSLIVIPMVLIGRALGQTTLGFVAALLASIANSYYNRTMVGYYDTDMLTIVLPLISIYAIILAVQTQKRRFLPLITLFFALSQWWYPQSYSLNTAILVMTLAYTVVFERKNRYFYQISLFVIIGILTLPLWVKGITALAVLALFYAKPTLKSSLFWGLFGVVLLVHFSTGGIEPIVNQLKSYVVGGSVSTGEGLYFYDVVATVREAGSIPFEVFAQRISGHTITFVLACMGYVGALIAYRPLLLTLPLVGLGFIAMNSGLRFTIYAVPAMAIGFAYLVMLSTRGIALIPLRYGVIALLTTAALYPNYLHIREYMTPSVFVKQEVSLLNQLGEMSNSEDYVVTWWDFGYPIRYYSDVKTLVDGGKHTGDVNYPVSFALTQPQNYSAYMGRLAVEYTQKSFENNKSAIVEHMLKDFNVSTIDDMMVGIDLNTKVLPKSTRNVYFYLPLRMMEIFPTVALFSTLDIHNPNNKINPPFFYSSDGAQDMGKSIELGNGISLLKDKNMISIQGQEIPIKSFYEVGYGEDKKVRVNEQSISSSGMSVVYMASYGKFLVMDDFYFNSSYIQMFVFENYDKKLFEPVILDPLAKVYKLKV
jgi:dolichyl-diphosphooligosaccharide--protein glycosyltransferase/undecaprenyl-diphosphooligosaccharide--protein glycosyltransferase